MTDEQTTAFLEALREFPLVGEAARVAGVLRSTVYLERMRNPAFKEAWDEAQDTGLEASMLRLG